MWWLLSIAVRVLAPTPCRLEPMSPSEPGTTTVDGGSAMTTEVVLADEDTRGKIAKMLLDASHWAQREFPVVGSLLLATPWDHRHERINTLLDDWQAAHE